MRIFTIIFWSIWTLSLLFLVSTSSGHTIENMILFLTMLSLSGIIMYVFERQRKLINRLEIMIKNIDFKPIEEEIKKISKERTGFYAKIFNLEDNLGEYKKDREEKYRDVVKKVLRMDNKLNEKFKLVGDAVLRLKNEIEN